MANQISLYFHLQQHRFVATIRQLRSVVPILSPLQLERFCQMEVSTRWNLHR
jgi:hypothetical protein